MRIVVRPSQSPEPALNGFEKGIFSLRHLLSGFYFERVNTQLDCSLLINLSHRHSDITVSNILVRLEQRLGIYERVCQESESSRNSNAFTRARIAWAKQHFEKNECPHIIQAMVEVLHQAKINSSDYSRCEGILHRALRTELEKVESAYTFLQSPRSIEYTRNLLARWQSPTDLDIRVSTAPPLRINEKAGIDILRIMLLSHRKGEEFGFHFIEDNGYISDVELSNGINASGRTRGGDYYIIQPLTGTHEHTARAKRTGGKVGTGHVHPLTSGPAPSYSSGMSGYSATDSLSSDVWTMSLQKKYDIPTEKGIRLSPLHVIPTIATSMNSMHASERPILGIWSVEQTDQGWRAVVYPFKFVQPIRVTRSD